MFKFAQLITAAVGLAGAACGDSAVRSLVSDAQTADARDVAFDAASAANDINALSAGQDASAIDALPPFVDGQSMRPLTVVNTCTPQAYVDRSAPDADRTLAWAYGFRDDERCLIIRVGQSVLWQGNLNSHPLDAEGGDSPNPIVRHVDGLVTFGAPGTFGYVCGAAHAGMYGAIHVVP